MALEHREHILDSAWKVAGLETLPLGPDASSDGRNLVVGQSYCVQVRARGGRVNLSAPVWGDFTQLDDGTGAAFTFSGFADGNACSSELRRGVHRG